MPTNRPRHHQTFWVGEGRRSRRRPFFPLPHLAEGRRRGPFSPFLNGGGYLARRSRAACHEAKVILFLILFSVFVPEQKLRETMRAKEKKERKVFIDIIEIRSVNLNDQTYM